MSVLWFFKVFFVWSALQGNAFFVNDKVNWRRIPLFQCSSHTNTTTTTTTKIVWCTENSRHRNWSLRLSRNCSLCMMPIYTYMYAFHRSNVEMCNFRWFDDMHIQNRREKNTERGIKRERNQEFETKECIILNLHVKNEYACAHCLSVKHSKIEKA